LPNSFPRHFLVQLDVPRIYNIYSDFHAHIITNSPMLNPC
jgi:hypothetical protein